jgi:hypothetical protein
MKHILMVAALLIGISTLTNAQKVKMTDGNLDPLKGVKQMNVVYDYSNMDVGKKTEKEYVAEKKSAYNRKEPGRGDKWEQGWIADRSGRYEPRFEEQFNKSSNIVIGLLPKEKYTMIVKTTFTEPGFNIGITRKNAYVDVHVTIVETANRSHIIAEIDVLDCPGRTVFGNDYDSGERIQEAYAMAGKGLAKYLGKNID